MSSATIVPFNPTGVQPIGNGSGSNNPGPTSILGSNNGSNFTLPPSITGATPIQSRSPIPVTPTAMTTQSTGQQIGSVTTPQSSTTAVPTTNSTSSVANTAPSTSPGQQPNLTNSLNNIFGSGVGGLLGEEIGDIGSEDSSYMQNYANAMAPENAENLATLQTTLGNEGVGANSSTAAIAQADFQSNVSSQEGLQEQQLQMNDLSQLLGLTETLEQPAQEAQQDSWQNLLGGVVGEVGGDVAKSLIGGALS